MFRPPAKQLPTARDPIANCVSNQLEVSVACQLIRKATDLPATVCSNLLAATMNDRFPAAKKRCQISIWEQIF